jgi:hypothetical protein
VAVSFTCGETADCEIPTFHSDIKKSITENKKWQFHSKNKNDTSTPID